MYRTLLLLSNDSAEEKYRLPEFNADLSLWAFSLKLHFHKRINAYMDRLYVSNIWILVNLPWLISVSGGISLLYVNFIFLKRGLMSVCNRGHNLQDYNNLRHKLLLRKNRRQLINLGSISLWSCLTCYETLFLPKWEKVRGRANTITS